MTLTDEIREKRVAVAQDVRDRLEAGTLQARVNTYLRTTDKGDAIAVAARDRGVVDLGAIVDDLGPNCETCALGSMVLVKARLFDAVPLAGALGRYSGMMYLSRSAVNEALGGLFDVDTLDRIESAFERCDRRYAREGYDADIDRAIAFGCGYACPRERCLALMQNLIENRGEFRP